MQRQVLSIILFASCVLAGPAVLSLRADDGLPGAAREVLERRCFACHGRNGIAARGVYVLELQRLVDSRMVVPGSAASPLLRAVESGAMPPGAGKLAEAEIALLRRWIEAGAPDWEIRPAGAGAAAGGFQPEEALLAALRRDLEAAGPETRSHLRYFSLAHLRNAGVPEVELEGYRTGLSRLLNSLSWAPRITRPRSVDPARTLLRIDLRDFGWDSARWRCVLAAYPYGIETAGSRAVERLMGAELPYVRADWFVARASVPPLYPELLDLPDNVADLEAKLGVESGPGVRDGRGIFRAGFRASGVSRHNRVVERHPLPSGAYWKSYDFSSSQGDRNIFRNPLDFHADGGEMIFNLPNGMQAYFITDGRGRRLDRAPVAIVADRNHPEEPEVINGRSCMGCHHAGMKTFRDEVRPLAERLADAPFDRQRVLALYAPAEPGDRLLAEDSARFGRAVEQAGGLPSADFRTEPVDALARRFAADLTPAQAAAEVGLELPELRARLARSARLIQLGLGQLLQPEGGVKRDVWEEHFVPAVVELGVGEPPAVWSGPRGGVLLLAADDLPTRVPDPGDRAAPSVERFLRNTAHFFTRGRSGRFLVYSGHPSFGPKLQAVLRRAGHTVTQSTTPATLTGYDAVFTGGDGTVDPQLLGGYVAGGGKVYLAAGTGEIPGEATFWNGMLRRFGLSLWDSRRGKLLQATRFEPGQLFAGVTALPLETPNPIALLPGEWPGSRILAAAGGVNCWALYTTDPAWRVEREGPAR